MIVISKKRLIISLILIFSLMVILLMVSINASSTTPIDKSIEKQRILFWGIILVLIQIIISLSIFSGHRKLIDDLKKIINYKDLNHPQSIKIMKQLGTLGGVFNQMVRDQNNLLQLRMNRIYASSKVLKILCEDYPEALLISDTLGSLLGVSSILIKKSGVPMRGDTKISDYFPEVKQGEVLTFLEKNREIWKNEELGILCTPIFDKSDQLNLCIWEMEKSHFLQKLSKNSGNTIAKKPFKLFSRNKKTKPTV